MDQIYIFILSALAALIVLTVHEYSHGYAAYLLGDPTARNLGRLSLNPIKHIDPFGALCMVLFRFGWAKPVPINPRYFKNPKRDFAITALAGPLSNIILGFISAFLYLLVFAIFRNKSFESEFAFNIIDTTLAFLLIFHSINIGIAIFNLIPIPPLDGSRLLTAVLPDRIYYKILQNERKIYIAFIIWILGGDTIVRALRSLPFISSSPVLYKAFGYLSLTELLGTAIDFVSGLMMDFWQLIPFLKI